MEIGYLNPNPFASDEEQFVLTPEQQRAARLRNAGPEMLAALRSAVAIIESMGGDASRQRAAIAKVEG
jgi:hypothetical protein